MIFIRIPQNIHRIILIKTARLRQMALRRVLGYNKRAAARRNQAPVSKTRLSLHKQAKNHLLNHPPKTVAIALTRLRFATVIFRRRTLFKRTAVQTVGVNLRKVGKSGESSPVSWESS